VWFSRQLQFLQLPGGFRFHRQTPFSFYGNDGTKFSKKRTAIESVLPNRLRSGNQKRFWRDPTMLAHIATTESVVVHADEKLTAFLELEAAIRACGELS
jgi:hypothetical protein